MEGCWWLPVFWLEPNSQLCKQRTKWFSSCYSFSSWLYTIRDTWKRSMEGRPHLILCAHVCMCSHTCMYVCVCDVCVHTHVCLWGLERGSVLPPASWGKPLLSSQWNMWRQSSSGNYATIWMSVLWQHLLMLWDSSARVSPAKPPKPYVLISSNTHIPAFQGWRIVDQRLTSQSG